MIITLIKKVNYMIINGDEGTDGIQAYNDNKAK